MTGITSYDTLTKQELIRVLRQRDALLESTGHILKRLREQQAAREHIVEMFDGMGSLTKQR